MFFFFQAEDGIRDDLVTGVQTCALPILLDYNNAFMTPIHHPVSAIVYSALGHEVTSVMIFGRFVMRDGVVSSVDEAAVRKQAQLSADALTKRAGTDASKHRPSPN